MQRFGWHRKPLGERGVTAIEYGLIAALIAVVIIIVFTMVGGNLEKAFQQRSLIESYQKALNEYIFSGPFRAENVADVPDGCLIIGDGQKSIEEPRIVRVMDNKEDLEKYDSFNLYIVCPNADLVAQKLATTKYNGWIQIWVGDQLVNEFNAPRR